MCWAEESPTWLYTAVASTGRALDHLVALDGKYALWPGSLDAAASPVEQSQAVLEAAELAGVPVTLHRPTEPFAGNEVEKRNLSLDLALSVADEGDWLLVFDADMTLTGLAASFRDALGAYGGNAAEYARFDTLDPQALTDRDVLARNVTYLPTGMSPVRGMYRAIPSLRYGPAHWHVSYDAPDGVRWLWGVPRRHRPYEGALDLTGSVVFAHRNPARERGRREKAAEYYRLRDATGAERQARLFMEGLDGKPAPLPDRA